MEKQAEYISSIEIKALWKGGRHIIWTLRPDVNILSGINGVGKSTIINHSVKGLHLIDSGELHAGEVGENITIKLFPEDAKTMKFDVIRSFDRPLLHSDPEVSKPKAVFQDMIDQLFSDTEKKIDRKNNEIQFHQNGETLTPYQLSSGEKQLLVILLTVLVENNEHYALLMDEPEISLHIEWQQQLIGLIRKLNPNAQIILSTHSPALIMDGWMDVVTEVNEITN